jgi:starvation-inducible DNA-binding protein
MGTTVVAAPTTRTKEVIEITEVGVSAIAQELRRLLADVFAVYLKTKNFHWHMRGSHFRDYHLLLDEQATQIFAMSDVIAERSRKLGATTLHSIGDIARYQRIEDNNETTVAPEAMLAELLNDNRLLTSNMRSAHELFARENDVATTSLIENWIDETEGRTWFLAEICSDELQRIAPKCVVS